MLRDPGPGSPGGTDAPAQGGDPSVIPDPVVDTPENGIPSREVVHGRLSPDFHGRVSHGRLLRRPFFVFSRLRTRVGIGPHHGLHGRLPFLPLFFIQRIRMVHPELVPAQFKPGLAPVLPDIPASPGRRGHRHDHAAFSWAGVGPVHRNGRLVSDRNVLPVKRLAAAAPLLLPKAADILPVFVCVPVNGVILKLRLGYAGVLRLPCAPLRIRIDLKALLNTAGLRHHQDTVLVVYLRRSAERPGPPGAPLIGGGIPEILVDQDRIQHIPLINRRMERTVVVMLLDHGHIPEGFVHAAEVASLGAGPCFNAGQVFQSGRFGIILIKPDGVPGIQGLHSGPDLRRVCRNPERDAPAPAVRGRLQFFKGHVPALQVLPDLCPDAFHCRPFLREVLSRIQCQKLAQVHRSFTQRPELPDRSRCTVRYPYPAWCLRSRPTRTYQYRR